MFNLNKESLKLGRGSGQAQNAGKAKPISDAAPDSPEDRQIALWAEQNKERISKFVGKVKENYNGVVIPDVSYVDGRYVYLPLKDVEEPVASTDFLEKLSHAKVGVLERFVFNKFLICPEHHSSFLVNVRLFCPKCSSIGIDKLHLLEHKSCGYLAEKTKFSNGDSALKCPSCSKMIKDSQKEMRVPATWYFCNDCKEKFDDAAIRFYCKEYDHDFHVSEAKAVTIFGYTLLDSGDKSQFDHIKLKDELVKLMSKLGLATESNYTVRGKSGQDHMVDVYGVDGKGQTVFVMINSTGENMVDSKMLQILDTTPKAAILIGYSSIAEKTKSIASKYNVSIITSQGIPEILLEAEKILLHRLKRLDVVSK